MTIPTTFISVHAITGLLASSSASDAMLTLLVEGEHGNMQLSLFFSDEDPDRALRLVGAINAAMAAPLVKSAPCPHETAAYNALHYTYMGFER